MTLRRWLGLGVAAAALSCSTAAVVSNTNNIVRASDVEFVCLEVDASDVTAGRVRPITDCGLNADNTPATENLHVHALVLQSDRGELGLIDLATTTGFALFDNSPGVPGFSFIPVGPLPTALVTDVRAAGSGSVWVASAGGRQIVRVDASTLRKDPRRNPAAGSRTTLSVDGVPHDLAIDTVGTQRRLYATFPNEGAVGVYDVTDASNPTLAAWIALDGTSGAMDAGVDADLDGSTTVDGGADGGVTGRARPYALAIDPDTHRLYVSDEARSTVHVLDADTLRESGTLDLGAPTRSLTVTAVARARRRSQGDFCPPPTAADPNPDPDHCARARYLYASTIPAGDVRVWDLTRGALVRPNVLPAPNTDGQRVDPSRPAEVVPLRAPVTALVAINTGEYNAENPDEPLLPRTSRCDLYPCSSIATDPNQLRGVFVGAVLRDGNLVVIDVDDYDAPCRETRCPSASVPVYRFVRHAPRALTALTTAPALAAAPGLVVPVGTGGVATVEGRGAPGFSCGATRSSNDDPPCNPANNFGVDLTRSLRGGPTAGPTAAGADPSPPTVTFTASTDETSRVVDPYVARNESWTFVWEGILPGLDQYGGALSARGDAVALDAPGAAFCARGVLAEAASHDLVVLVSDPTPATEDQGLCAELFGGGTGPLNRDFVVSEASQGQLVLTLPEGLRAAPGGASVVPRCYPQATHFQVRARQQWVVQGSRAAYRHTVRAGDGGRCERDPVAQAAADVWIQRCRAARGVADAVPTCPVGRACVGVPVSGAVTRAATPVVANEWFCAQIFPGLQGQSSAATAAPIVRDTLLSFAITGAYEPFATLTGVFPLTARALPRVGRVFVVDTALNGLVEFALNPFARGRTFN